MREGRPPGGRAIEHWSAEPRRQPSRDFEFLQESDCPARALNAGGRGAEKQASAGSRQRSRSKIKTRQRSQFFRTENADKKRADQSEPRARPGSLPGRSLAVIRCRARVNRASRRRRRRHLRARPFATRIETPHRPSLSEPWLVRLSPRAKPRNGGAANREEASGRVSIESRGRAPRGRVAVALERASPVPIRPSFSRHPNAFSFACASTEPLDREAAPPSSLESRAPRPGEPPFASTAAPTRAASTSARRARARAART